jgi:hypothetical protein
MKARLHGHIYQNMRTIMYAIRKLTSIASKTYLNINIKILKILK